MKVLLGMGCLASLLAGCVSGAVNGAGEFQWGDHEEYTLSEKNRQALMNLRQGMSLDEVRAVMGGRRWLSNTPAKPSGIIALGLPAMCRKFYALTSRGLRR